MLEALSDDELALTPNVLGELLAGFRAGARVPANDLWIAASAMQHGGGEERGRPV